MKYNWKTPGTVPDKRRQKRVSLLILVAAVTVAPMAIGQQQDESSITGAALDPIAFRGPDPAEQFQEIYIEQKLDAQIPLELPFRDEHGKEVKLGDYFGEKPVVLSLVYYECPMLCTLVLNGEVAALDAGALDLEIGKDFEAVTVSIDPGETPALAREKKANYLEKFRGTGAEEGWHFLTGDEDAIEQLAQAIGFRYYYDEQTDQYAHASGITIATPDGKVSSYYLGIEYLPKKLRMALLDAGQGKIGTIADQLVLLCFAYDPSTGAYGFYVMGAVRLFGIAIVAAFLAFWLSNYVRARRKRARAEQNAQPSLMGTTGQLGQTSVTGTAGGTGDSTVEQ